VVVSFLLRAFQGGLLTLLDELFATLDGTAVRRVTKSALSKARQRRSGLAASSGHPPPGAGRCRIVRGFR